MLEKVYLKEEFFLDIPSEISTTGMKPGRGVYVRIAYGYDKYSWIDRTGREIDHPDWIDYLDKLYKNK